MMMRMLAAAGVAALLFSARLAGATEICGNDIDDDANGMTDEGCAPTATTSVCESPLSCGDTGMVSWSTGALHYDLPPDANPRVPYGSGIGLRRFYTSMYAPGTGPSSVNHAPMGARWQHTYMSWIDRFQVSGTWRVVLHTSEGRDVFATLSSTVGGWEYYTPQAGFHVMSIARNTSSPNQYQIQLLTGELLYYNNVGQLTQIWDSLPSPYMNKVLVTWTSTSGGNVSTVTDAAGARRLLFNYTSNLLTWVNYQVKIGGTWTTEQTTTYTYTSGTLTSVNVGASLTQQYGYTSGYLTSITDASSNLIASFTYDGTSAGKVVRVDTPKGMVGFDYNSSRLGCTSDTVLYFNRAATTSCSVDTDCATGYLCGGKTGTGSTGQCFYAGRCMGLSTVNSESVVTTVSPIGNSSGCTGACTDVAQYVWSTGTGLLNLSGTEDPLGNYTSATYNANGLPTQITYGDDDSDPTTVPTSGARTTWLFYDTTYPGRVTEMRRPSDLVVRPPCSATNTSGCARSIYTFGSDTTLQTFTQSGTTLDATGTATSFSYATGYVHDTKGRLTEIDGPVTGMKTTFEYFSSTDLTKDGFLQDYKVYKDASNHLDTTILSYDTWGNVTGRQDPDGTVSCRTFDASRNYLTQTREAMAGQTDCTTTNAADLTTGWVRDSALRLTQLTRPDGSCVFSGYDARGRLSTVKRRDDCNATSSGDFQQYTYDTEGLLTEVDTYGSSGTLTAKQPYTYYDSRKLHTIVNPAKTTVSKSLIYDARGLVQEVDDESSLGKTVYTINADHRITEESRYKTSSTYDSWTLLYDWLGDESQVTDGDSKTTQSVRDDLGRYVKLTSPDISLPIIKVFDAAGRLTTQVDGYDSFKGGPAHTFTYDGTGRPLNSDYFGTCPTGTAHPEIQKTYDAMPTGVTCPISGGCNYIAGRLSYVKVSLMCSSAYSDDGSLDQETFYSYDAAGRIVDEYIRDDSGRIADHQYAWTKDGALSQITTPSGALFGWTFGSTGDNSDTDRIAAVWQSSTSTPIVDSVTWFPFGPLKQYNQENAIGGEALQTVASRNLAYRLSDLRLQTISGTEEDGLALTEDDKGRVTRRDLYDNSIGIRDSYFHYDDEDRVLCETAISVSSCPTTAAATTKNSHSASPPFTNAGDWKLVLRDNNGTAGSDTFTLNSGTHQVSEIYQDAMLGGVFYYYSSIGNRSSDAASGSGQTHTGRTYTYDGRRNLVNLRGQYVYSTNPFTHIRTWHYDDVTSAFDARNRRVFKSSYDETTGLTRNTFFYYDPLDRLTEIRYTPDISAPSTYSLYEIVWLGHRPVAYVQTDYPGPIVSKRYPVTDETNRIIAMWTWPTSGDATLVWAIDPNAWGLDVIKLGSAMLQPLVFAGQYQDWETYTYSDNGSVHEYALNANGHRAYDPFTGGYLQFDPLVDNTWSSYLYVDGDPVGQRDPSGLASYVCGHDSTPGWQNEDGSYSPGNEPTDEDEFCDDAETGEDHSHDPPNPDQGDDDHPGGGSTIPAGVPVGCADYTANAGDCPKPKTKPPRRDCNGSVVDFDECHKCEYYNYDWVDLWSCRSGSPPKYKMDQHCHDLAFALYTLEMKKCGKNPNQCESSWCAQQSPGFGMK